MLQWAHMVVDISNTSTGRSPSRSCTNPSMRPLVAVVGAGDGEGGGAVGMRVSARAADMRLAAKGSVV